MWSFELMRKSDVGIRINTEEIRKTSKPRNVIPSTLEMCNYELTRRGRKRFKINRVEDENEFEFLLTGFGKNFHQHSKCEF